MNASSSNSTIAVASVIAFIGMFAVAVSAINQKSTAAPWLRVLDVILFGIYGGTAIQASFKPRYDADGPISKLSPIWVSQGLHGMAGIMWTLWSAVAFVLISRAKQKHHPFTYIWADHGRRLAPFFVSVVDACFMAAVAVAAVYGSQDIPRSLGQCSTYEVYNRWPITESGRENECRRMITIQILASLSLAVMATQILLLLPVMAPPTVIRATVLLIARRLRFRSSHRRKFAKFDSPTPEGHSILSEKASLQAVFKSDTIATSLSYHLHFNDINNVARTSKIMRRAVFRPTDNDLDDRRHLLGETCCSGSIDKSECWACGQLVCENCISIERTLVHPRTRVHLNKCYAKCTKCYIKSHGVRPAPLSGTWNPCDLSVQHLERTEPDTIAGTWTVQSVCRSCDLHDNEGISLIRERRDEMCMKKALGRRVRCNTCEKALPKGRKRWWICRAGNHECHWAGHEAT